MEVNKMCIEIENTELENKLKYIIAIREGQHDKRRIKPKLFVCFTYRVVA